MKRMLVVLAVLFLTAPAVQAQHRGNRRNYGYGSAMPEVRQWQSSMRGFMRDGNRDFAQDMCGIWGPGSIVGQSWCNGVKLDATGQYVEGFNPLAVRNRGSMEYGYSGFGDYGYSGYYDQGRRYRNRVGARDVVEVLLGGVAGFALGRATAPHAEDHPQERAAIVPQREAPKTIELVINQTGCVARVNGTVLQPGDSVRVDTATSGVSVQSTTCAPAYRNLQPGVVALVCTR